MQSLIARRIQGSIPLYLLLLLSGFQALTAETYKGFREGRWEGPVYNKTGNVTGKGQLDILSISADGAVRAHLREYDGLEGEGGLSGAINVHGVMQLQGELTSPSSGEVWQSDFFAVMQNSDLRFGNRLTHGGKLEEESATMSYAGALPLPPHPPGPDAGSGGIPPNVYLWTMNGIEVEAWYFGAHGRVWRNLREGFTQAGLDAHEPRWRGTYRLNGEQLSITADDGTIHQHTYKLNRGRHQLDDMSLTTVNPATDPQLLVGEYTHSGGNSALRTASSLTLRADGTYTRLDVGSSRADDGESFGGATDDTGTWEYTTHTLTFRGRDGSVKQQIALIAPKGSVVGAMGYLYVGGKLYRHKQ